MIDDHGTGWRVRGDRVDGGQHVSVGRHAQGDDIAVRSEFGQRAGRVQTELVG